MVRFDVQTFLRPIRWSIASLLVLVIQVGGQAGAFNAQAADSIKDAEEGVEKALEKAEQVVVSVKLDSRLLSILDSRISVMKKVMNDAKLKARLENIADAARGDLGNASLVRMRAVKLLMDGLKDFKAAAAANNLPDVLLAVHDLQLGVKDIELAKILVGNAELRIATLTAILNAL